MQKLALACAALLLTGCGAFPVIDTTLPENWKSAQRYGTGTHLTASTQTNTKYMDREEFENMRMDRTGSKEVSPR